MGVAGERGVEEGQREEDEGKLFRQLLGMLEFYLGFEIKDQTGEAMNDQVCPALLSYSLSFFLSLSPLLPVTHSPIHTHTHSPTHALTHSLTYHPSPLSPPRR